MNDFLINTKKFCIAIAIIGLLYLLLHLFVSCTPINGAYIKDTNIEIKEVKYKGHSYIIFTEPFISAGRFSVVHNPDCCK